MRTSNSIEGINLSFNNKMDGLKNNIWNWLSGLQKFDEKYYVKLRDMENGRLPFRSRRVIGEEVQKKRVVNSWDQVDLNSDESVLRYMRSVASTLDSIDNR